MLSDSLRVNSCGGRWCRCWFFFLEFIDFLCDLLTVTTCFACLGDGIRGVCGEGRLLVKLRIVAGGNFIIIILALASLGAW